MNERSFMEYAGIAWRNLVHRKKRAYLTVLGIFIGVMAVVALISLGEGLQQGVNAEFEKLGVDKIFVEPASVFGGSAATAPKLLSDSDLRRVQTTAGVKEAIALNYRTARITYNNEIAYVYVISEPTVEQQRQLFGESMSTTMQSGRDLTQGDSSKVVLSSNFASKVVFSKPISVGSSITINNKSFTVAGIRASTGSPDDSDVMIPQTVYSDVIGTPKDQYDMIVARSQQGLGASDVAVNIKQELRHLRGEKAGDEDFTVQTSDDIKAQAESILGIIQAVLIGIAAISLVVGGVGIMNTMYTAVLERTREIGIMKAVGATNGAILAIFIIEAGMLGLAGGAVGVVLGLLLSYGAATIATYALGTSIIQAYISWWLILGALAFSFFAGTIAGLLPARQASSMNPVDSLRYE